MRPEMDDLTADTIVAFIGSIFDRRGGEEYLGEPVTIGEHMLQAATIAECNGQPKEIIVSALLHDIGHPAFSHAFEHFMDSTEAGKAMAADGEKWSHEDASAALINVLLRKTKKDAAKVEEPLFPKVHAAWKDAGIEWITFSSRSSLLETW